jgi:hypothetical protein
MIVVPFRAEHLARLGEQEEQAWALPLLTPERAKSLESTKAFTGMVDDEVLICAGVIRVWEGRYLAWAYPGPRARRRWKSIHRRVKEFLRDLDARRIEANVDCDFAAARRWAEALGFKVEVERMRRFLPNGADATLYAIVKG